MLKVKVEQFEGVKNQFTIVTNIGTFFQSYNSVIALKDKRDGKIYLDKTYWDYSKTTTKYLNKFLYNNNNETKAKIKSGEYILTDLDN